MKEGFRQSQAWLHTWSGLIMGWLLFMIFITGTLSFFREEITYWMHPELPNMVAQPDPNKLFGQAITQLADKGKGAKFWAINLPNERNPALKITWFGKTNGNLLLDPNTGDPIKIRASVGGSFYYQMHFQLWYLNPFIGRIIICLITLFMLIALITGIIIHKKIFKDFFVFRANKGQRSWLDGHNVTAVLALPFHLMITFSGLLILVGFFMPWATNSIYGKERAKIYQDAYNMPNFNQAASGITQSVPSLSKLIAQFAEIYPNSKVQNIMIYNPQQTNSQIMLLAYSSQIVNQPALLFNSQGQLIDKIQATGPAAAIQKTLDSLHRGHFANYLLRWLYFLSGIAGCFMIASGLILWTIKRQARSAKACPNHIPFSQRLVQVLNVSSIAGICVAIPSLLLANRLLADTLPHRSDWEVRCFFIVWGFTLIYSYLRPHRQAWAELFGLAALSCFAIPIINKLTTSQSLVTYLQNSNWQLAGVELITLVFALLFSWLSYKIVAHKLPAQCRSKVSNQALMMEN